MAPWKHHIVHLGRDLRYDLLCFPSVSADSCLVLWSHWLLLSLLELPDSETEVTLAAELAGYLRWESNTFGGTVKSRNAVKSPCSYFPVYKCDISMENIPSHSCLLFFLLFLKSICNWPLCPVHLASSFYLEAHWVSLKPNQPGDFGTRMKGPRGPKCKSQFVLRVKPRWWAVGIQPMWVHRLKSPQIVIKGDMYFGEGQSLLCSDLWRNTSGPLLKIRSLLSLMDSRFGLMWPSRQF